MSRFISDTVQPALLNRALAVEPTRRRKHRHPQLEMPLAHPPQRAGAAAAGKHHAEAEYHAAEQRAEPEARRYGEVRVEQLGLEDQRGNGMPMASARITALVMSPSAVMKGSRTARATQKRERA